MNTDDFPFTVVGIVTVASLFASVLLGIIFALKYRERRDRWFPIGYAFVLFIFSSAEDGRGDPIWRCLTLAWSAWVTWFAITRLHWSGGKLVRTLRIALTMASVGEMMLCAVFCAVDWAHSYYNHHPP